MIVGTLNGALGDLKTGKLSSFPGLLAHSEWQRVTATVATAKVGKIRVCMLPQMPFDRTHNPSRTRRRNSYRFRTLKTVMPPTDPEACCLPRAELLKHCKQKT